MWYTLRVTADHPPTDKATDLSHYSRFNSGQKRLSSMTVRSNLEGKTMHEPLFENNYGDDKHNDDDSM